MTINYKPTKTPSIRKKGKSKTPLDSSINSGIEALEMSYNTIPPDVNDEGLTPEEAEEVANLPKSTWTKFLSPAERKRQQKLKAEAAEAKKKKQEEEEAASMSNKFDGSQQSPAEGMPPKISEGDERSTGSDSLTPEEKEKAAAIAKTSFVSPAERKRRQSMKLKEMEDNKKAAAAEAPPTPGSVGGEGSYIGSVEDEGGVVKPEVQKLNALTAEQQAAKEREEALERERKERELAAARSSSTGTAVAESDSQPTAQPIAQDASGGGEDGDGDAGQTSIPLESDREKNKRAAIQRVMKDTSLTPVERNQAIQKIIKGEFGDTPISSKGDTAAVVSKGVPDMAESSSEESSSEEEESSSEEESGEEWSTSSGEYETDSDDEEESKVSKLSKLSQKKEGAALASNKDNEPTAESAVTAASAASIAQKERVKELEAQLDQELAAEAELEKQRKAKLEAALDKEMQNHAQLEQQQKQRELEFQREEQQRAVARAAAEEEVLRRVTAEKQAKERKLQEELAAERKLQEEIAALRLGRERTEQQRRMDEETRRIEEESRRLREETQREEARLRALQEERDRQIHLAQEESRRLQDEQRRLQEEREMEQRRLNEQAALHQRLERERLLRSNEQEPGGQPPQQVARAVPPRSELTRQPSLRSSQLLATRQGGGVSSEPTTSYASQMSALSNTRPPQQRGSQVARAGRYDGVDDDELNWRLDSYVSLSDYTIVINRARPGRYAPDFDTTDVTGIDFVTESNGALKQDAYYVHKAMIAVGSRRSELLGRRIREAESRGASPDGHSSEVNIHETVMLDSAADAMGIVLDFCYYPDRPLDINKENAVPLVYLGKRYKIRALLEQAEVYVMENIVSTTAMYFLLDSYLFQLEEILSRSIDVTAANLSNTVDFEPIYKLPPELFRRVILSKELSCESELLSLIVYSYCGEHHAEDIDVEYFRELTKPRIMPDIDPKVALMVLKLYVDLILADDASCEIMEALPGDSLMNRCITVVAKHWQPEVCEPMIADAKWDNPGRNLGSHEPAALHRLLPPPLQNYLLEQCILAAKNDVDSEKTTVDGFEGRKRTDMENETKTFETIIQELQGEVDKANSSKGTESEAYRKQIDELQRKARELEKQLDEKTKAVEDYKQELSQFRRVPGIHNFGEVAKGDPKIIDKTKCTYSANPDHHYPNHRRGSRRPTAMPEKGTELGNLAKENGYIYDDGKGGLLPVFYYQKKA